METTNEQIKNDRKTWIKFGFIAAAVGVGTYYGAGRHIVKMSKDVKKINNTLAAVGDFLTAESIAREAAHDAQRAAIVAARANGLGFTFFPGLGVLHHAVDEAA